ncbi:MAG: hypothetical protein ACI87W_001902 [Halieaceae bacterium]|jgi:hypothetical protein
MSKHLVTALLSRMLLVSCSIIGSHAATAQQEDRISNRLTEFSGGPAQPRLQGVSATFTLSIPLAGVSEVREATLELHATNSIALLPKRSILGVRFNNATIAQIPLRGDQPQLAYPVSIPPELWRKGFNSVEFFVTQRAVEMCEDSNAPELWTELDLFRSTLSVSFTRRYPTELAGLSALYNPGVGGESTALLLTPDTAPASGAIYRDALPRIAQALALRREYRALQFVHRSLSRGAPGETFALNADGALRQDDPLDPRTVAHYLNATDQHFHVLVGTRDGLANVLDEQTRKAITGPYLGLQATPAAGTFSADPGDEPQRYRAAHRLIVSGNNDDEVLMAARVLGRMLDPLQRGADLTVDSLTEDGPAPDSTINAGLRPGNEYRFAALGSGSRSFRGAGQFLTEIPVILPADFYVNESADAQLFLDFGYAPALGPASTVSVLVNGQVIGGIALDNPDGGAFYRYRLTIPARILRGGRNALSLEVNLRATLSDAPCDRPSSDHLLFNLRDTSSIVLPEAGRASRQPDLALLGRTGYPLSGQAPGQTVPIALGNAALTGAGLTVAGRLAQAAGVLIEELYLTTGNTGDTSAGALYMASLKDLPKAERDRVALALGATQQAPYQLQNTLYERISSLSYGDDQAPRISGGELSLTSSLGDLAVLHAARGDAASTRLLLTAESDSVLIRRVADLIEPALWGQLDGDVFAWRNNRQAELVMRVEPVHVIGDSDSPWLSLRLWLSNHPWLWLGALAGIIFLLSLIAFRLLRRRDEALSEDW